MLLSSASSGRSPTHSRTAACRPVLVVTGFIGAAIGDPQNHGRAQPRNRSRERLFAPGGAHLPGSRALQVQKLEAVLAREVADLTGRENDASPSVGRGGMRQAVGNSPWKMPPGLRMRRVSRQIFEHHIAAGDVLEHGVGIHEIEGLESANMGQARCLGGVDVGVWDERRRSRAMRIISSETSTPWISAEVAGERASSGGPARSRFRAPRRGDWRFSGQPLQLGFDGWYQIGGGGQKSLPRPDPGCRTRHSNARLRGRARSSPGACARRQLPIVFLQAFLTRRCRRCS